MVNLACRGFQGLLQAMSDTVDAVATVAVKWTAFPAANLHVLSRCRATFFFKDVEPFPIFLPDVDYSWCDHMLNSPL